MTVIHQEEQMLARIRSIAVAFFILLGCIPAVFADPGARTVKYAETDIIPVHAKIRFSTLIVLASE